MKQKQMIQKKQQKNEKYSQKGSIVMDLGAISLFRLPLCSFTEELKGGYQ